MGYRVFSILSGVVAGLLVLALLLGAVQWLGTSAAPAGAGRELGERFRMYVANQVSDALEGILSVERVYWIDRGDLTAPRPDPACYGEGLPESLDFSGAEKLLDGQPLFFSSQITPMPGTAARYYLDETILAVTWKQVMDDCVYTFSEVKIAHPSQFRRFLSGGEFGSDKLLVTTEMAQSVNAVVASSGDFYSYRRAGTLVYDGTVRRVDNGLVDTCYVNEDGDLLFTRREDSRSVREFQQFVDENRILFSLAFGPVLIEDGQVVTPDSYAVGEIGDRYPRSALCQLGQLHYLLAVANAEGDWQSTPTIHEFASNLRDLGIQRAYALDGGQTAVIAMDGQLINAVLYGHQRKISDIIYFATAIPEGG